MAQLHDVAVGLNYFVRVTRSQGDQSGYRPQRNKMLDRLVSRAVFTITHCVVGKNENRRQLHQGRQPYGRARIIAENKKARTVRPKFRQRKSIHDRRHCMLANTEMEVSPAGIVSLEISRTGERQDRLVRLSDVRRSTEQPRDILGEYI